MPQLSNFIKNNAGNIAPTFALILLPILIAAGSAVDYSMFLNQRERIIASADAAILGASSSVAKTSNLENEEETLAALQTQIEPFLTANVSQIKGLTYSIDSVRYDPDSYGADLQVTFRYPTTIMQVIGINNFEYTADTAVNLSKPGEQSFSMFLVLDRSGSMGWQNRMTALKAAIDGMTTQFNTLDPDKKFVRTGAVGYNHQTAIPIQIDWGSAHVNGYTQALNADGGTNSSGAMQVAYDALSGTQEADIHATRNEVIPRKIIVFMTDGNNNRGQYDRDTLNHCDNAKSLEQVKIYTIAFQAPVRGQTLLQECASSPGHYFKADNANELMEVFRNIGDAVVESLVLSR